jgi:hypothetical protein
MEKRRDAKVFILLFSRKDAEFLFSFNLEEDFFFASLRLCVNGVY